MSCKYQAQETCNMAVNAPARPISGTMDVDEFMAFLETRPDEERWDLIEGLAVTMGPPTYAHQRIASNLRAVLNNAFAAQGHDLFAYQDAGVRNPGLRNFQPEPDVVVVPGVAGHGQYSGRFLLVAEVISPTNIRAEIDLKLRRYREAPHNLYALTIEPRELRVEIHARRADWQATVLTGPDDAIDMPEFGLHCTVADPYRGTPLDPHRAVHNKT
jgi:Uma2 family endonuclease